MHTKQGRDKSHSNTLESKSVIATVQVLTLLLLIVLETECFSIISHY